MIGALNYSWGGILRHGEFPWSPDARRTWLTKSRGDRSGRLRSQGHVPPIEALLWLVPEVRRQPSLLSRWRTRADGNGYLLGAKHAEAWLASLAHHTEHGIGPVWRTRSGAP